MAKNSSELNSLHFQLERQNNKNINTELTQDLWNLWIVRIMYKVLREWGKNPAVPCLWQAKVVRPNFAFCLVINVDYFFYSATILGLLGDYDIVTLTRYSYLTVEKLHSLTYMSRLAPRIMAKPKVFETVNFLFIVPVQCSPKYVHWRKYF